MVDIVPPEKRSLMMAGIRGKNTKPEWLIRKGIFARGWRYRLHDKLLPGKPDLVFPRLKAVIFVDGCYWHGHSCHLFKMPSSRTEFWLQKISRNQERDVEVRQKLVALGWRHLTVWECALRGKTRLPMGEVIDTVCHWLESGNCSVEVEGRVDGGR